MFLYDFIKKLKDQILRLLHENIFWYCWGAFLIAYGKLGRHLFDPVNNKDVFAYSLYINNPSPQTVLKIYVIIQPLLTIAGVIYLVKRFRLLHILTSILIALMGAYYVYNGIAYYNGIKILQGYKPKEFAIFFLASLHFLLAFMMFFTSLGGIDARRR